MVVIPNQKLTKITERIHWLLILTVFGILGESHASTCSSCTVWVFRLRFHVCELRFKYTTKFSLPKIACPAIVYAEIVVAIDLFFVGICPWIKVYRYNPTEICQQRLQGVRNVAQKLCSWERSFIYPTDFIRTTFVRVTKSDQLLFNVGVSICTHFSTEK